MNAIEIHRRMDAVKNRTRKADAMPLARPFTPWPARPGAFAGQCSFITSLTPNPKRLARQIHCVQSWIDIGVDVICVNTAAEIAELYFPPGVQTVASDDVGKDYDRATQRINALVNVGIETDRPFFLINSDIEVNGHTQEIEQALRSFRESKLTIGVRWNFDGRQEAQREPAGLDVFGLTPAMGRTLPSLPFSIGKPVWDYWLPHHFRTFGYGFHWINFPFFFHQAHAVQWSNEEWLFGARVLKTQYDLCLLHDSASFRVGLEV